MALLLATVWLAAGAVAVGYGLIRERGWIAVAGVVAIAYGSVWLRVATRAHLLSWREALVPWRARSGSRQ